VRVVPTWDGGAQILGPTGSVAEIFVTGEKHDVRPGDHHWIVMTSYCVDVDRLDTSVPGSGLGALGPEKIFQVTPVICGECAIRYTPEERNTVCRGEPT